MNTTKENRVHHVFESISERYDRMNSIISFNMHKRWRSDMMKRIDLHEGAAVLDVCCGTGDWTISIGRRLQKLGGDVIGLDFSENMLGVAKQKVNEASLNNITLLHGNASALPFPASSFDVVTIGFGLRNVPDPHLALKEMNRVLKPGGQVMCLDTSHPENRFYKPIYFFYFQHIMPRLGKWLARSGKEYAWLHESTIDFPSRKKLSKWFQQAGFERVEERGYAGGAAAGHWGYKP